MIQIYLSLFSLFAADGIWDSKKRWGGRLEEEEAKFTDED